MALSYIAYEAKTVTSLNCIIAAITGSPVIGDLVCDIYSDNAGLGPNTLISSSSATTGSFTVGGTIAFTLSQALTAGTIYWFVLRNTNGTPATNNASIRMTNSFLLMSHLQLGSSAALPFCKRGTTDSGSTWTASSVAGVGCMRWDFSDGSSDGFPVSSTGNPGSTNRAYAAGELGVRFRTPQNATVRVRGVVMPVSKAGAGPASGVCVKLYSGTTLLGTSYTVANALVSSSTTSIPFLFADPVVLQPNTQHYLVFASPSADGTSTNAWTTIEISYMDNSAATLSCFPLETVWARFDGSSWTVDDTKFIPYLFSLDADQDFEAGSGGATGSALNRGLN